MERLGGGCTLRIHQLPRVLRAHAESFAARRRVCAYAMQDRLLLRHASGARPTTRSMQKERPQSLKVWPRTAIKRAPFLATHHACMRAHDLPARSRPCVTQMSTGGRHTCRACSAMSGHSAVGATVRGLAFGGRSGSILCCLFRLSTEHAMAVYAGMLLVAVESAKRVLTRL